MVVRWLREVHKIIITVDYDEYELTSDNKTAGYGWNIQKTESPKEYLEISNFVFDTYEEAVNVAIKKALKLIN